MSEVLLTPSMLTPFGALNVKSSLSSPVATYVVPASVTVTSASSRPLSASDDGDVIEASGSTTAVTSIPPVVRSPLPACPESRTRTLSFASESKSPVKPSVRTASVPDVRLTLLIVAPDGALARAKSSLASPVATYVVPVSVTVTVAPARPVSASDDGDVISAPTVSTVAATRTVPVSMSELPVCPFAFARTLSENASS